MPTGHSTRSSTTASTATSTRVLRLALSARRALHTARHTSVTAFVKVLDSSRPPRFSFFFSRRGVVTPDPTPSTTVCGVGADWWGEG